MGATRQEEGHTGRQMPSARPTPGPLQDGRRPPALGGALQTGTGGTEAEAQAEPHSPESGAGGVPRAAVWGTGPRAVTRLDVPTQRRAGAAASGPH